jgi:hypothetical protein
VRVARWKKIAISFAVWTAAVELSAWIADAAFDYRAPLIEAIDGAYPRTDPLPESEPAWPVDVIRARVPDMYGPRSDPYMLGGRVISGAWPDAKQSFLRIEELASDPRPRVFVVGGSAALGFPYRYQSSFAQRLARARPDLHVINTGQAGWASGQELGLVRRITARFSPAVIVIYSTNNELFGWSQRDDALRRQLETQQTLAYSRALAAALFLGHRLRAREDRSARPLHGWRHAYEHPLDRFDARAWPHQRAAHLRVFRAHLRAMRDLARARGARVIMCTAPFSYRLSPSFHHLQPAIDVRAAAMEMDRNPAAALATLDRVLARDPSFALPHHMRGAALEALGRFQEAEAAYALSREHTIGNLGLRLSFNRIVREEARGEGVELLDLAQRFDEHEHAIGHWLNEDLVHDDCHPTPAGHELIARELRSRLE